MNVKSPSEVVSPCLMPRWEAIALTMTSEPQPPSWQGVWIQRYVSYLLFLRVSMRSRACDILVEQEDNGRVTHRRAGLDVVLAHRTPVVHRVERRHLVDTHGGHLQEASDLVHDADAGEAVLALGEVEQRHHGGLLVLRRVPLEDLGDDGLILLVELEGYVGVVVGGVAVLPIQCRQPSIGAKLPTI